MSSIRLLAPRASLSLHSRQLQTRLILPSIRYSTTDSARSPPKPRVLEKPERFNPPSHPSRRLRPRQYPGAPLSEHERKAQQTRKYPHMMPPEGTFMHWFLTNRNIHVYITMGILVCLMIALWVSDFVYKTPYLDLLPPKGMLLSHPFEFLERYWDVYRMHVEYISSETDARRKRKVDDALKRRQYRKAHGLNDNFWDRQIEDDEESEFRLNPLGREGGTVIQYVPKGSNAAVDSVDSTTANVPMKPEVQSEEGSKEQEVYLDFEGKPQAVRKKWFGIW